MTHNTHKDYVQLREIAEYAKNNGHEALLEMLEELVAKGELCLEERTECHYLFHNESYDFFYMWRESHTSLWVKLRMPEAWEIPDCGEEALDIEHDLTGRSSIWDNISGIHIYYRSWRS